MMHPDIEAALEVARSGSLRGDSAGRHDNQNISVPAESYVIPADVVSALGDGNTEAGFKLLEQMLPSPPVHAADGGKIPIVAAAGEFVCSPENVKRIGDGDLKRGHKALDEFVKRMRKKTISKLKKLPGPAKG